MPAPVMTSSAGATYRLALPAELEAVRESVRLARRFLAGQNLSEQELMACELALAEACNNAVTYSRSPEANPSVEIELCCDSELLEMHVVDHGPGFDWPE